MTLPRPSLCPMIPSLLIAALLAGCTGLPKVAPAYAVHDFGGPDPVAARSPGVPLRGLEVVAAPWLASTAIQYRLAYAQPTRRQAYVESRWAAQPAQLVELALKRAVRTGGEAGTSGACRLRVELDVAKELAGSGDDKRRVSEQRHRPAQGDIARFLMEISGVRLDVGIVQAQRQVAAVTLIPPFQDRKSVV